MDERFERFLASKAFGVVGASKSRDKYGNKVLRCYLQHGREAIPVNPRETSVEEGRYDRYAGALERLLAAMDFFSANHLAREGHPRFTDIWRRLVENSVIYLAPVAPHLAEECWELLGHRESVFAQARFPEGQSTALAELLSN